MVEKNLLQVLYNLFKRINSHGGVIEANILERYIYFIEHSENKENCMYAKKYKELFLKYDYEDIKKRFLEVLDKLREIEGENFGK